MPAGRWTCCDLGLADPTCNLLTNMPRSTKGQQEGGHAVISACQTLDAICSQLCPAQDGISKMVTGSHLARAGTACDLRTNIFRSASCQQEGGHARSWDRQAQLTASMLCLPIRDENMSTFLLASCLPALSLFDLKCRAVQRPLAVTLAPLVGRGCDCAAWANG